MHVKEGECGDKGNERKQRMLRERIELQRQMTLTKHNTE